MPDDPNTMFDAEVLEQAVRHAAHHVVHAVSGTPYTGAIPREADQEVGGAFVTLKRKNHLRACCGMLGGVFRMSDAVAQAARRTARDDQRFPVIRPAELAYLTVEVSVLHSFSRLADDPGARRDCVEVGRHGLTIRRDGRSGLLLPQVAVEQRWDAETFLRQLAAKAGLPTNAWEDPAAVVESFEAAHRAALLKDVAELPEFARAPQWTDAEVAQLERVAAANVAAIRQGSTPTYIVPGLPDGDADGVALWIGDPAQPGHLWMRYVQRGGVPLQATLFELADAAARSGRNGPIGIALLNRAWPLGTAADFDTRGFQVETQGLAVLERGTLTLAYDRSADVETLWERTAACAAVSDPTTAIVLAAECTTPRSALTLTTRPAAHSAPQVRPPAVAGRFYAGSAGELQRQLDDLWPTEEVEAAPWPAAMVPHAGLVFSGRIAADVLRRIAVPSHVIVLGPNHTGQGVRWAVAPVETWEIPGATIPGDLELARKLADEIDGLELDAAAHRSEHAIEVELPILHRVAPHARVVGIAVRGGTLESLHRFARRLAEIIKAAAEPPLLLISSDMNHFARDDETRRLDRLALDAMQSGDPDRLYEVVQSHRISMCGVLPAVVAMSALRELGSPLRLEEVAYDTSARVTGDLSRVVGYAGMLIGTIDNA